MRSLKLAVFVLRSLCREVKWSESCFSGRLLCLRSAVNTVWSRPHNGPGLIYSLFTYSVLVAKCFLQICLQVEWEWNQRRCEPVASQWSRFDVVPCCSSCRKKKLINRNSSSHVMRHYFCLQLGWNQWAFSSYVNSPSRPAVSVNPLLVLHSCSITTWFWNWIIYGCCLVNRTCL